jgi:imidazolonepropionase
VHTTKAVLVRGARQLITLRGPREPRRGTALRELGIIHDGAMLIRDGHIVAVGQGRRVENLAEARTAHEIDATGRVVLPGFVDCHTHFVPFMPRLAEYEFPGRRAETGASGGSSLSLRAARTTSSRTLARQARERLAAFARHGTTTVEVKAGSGRDKTVALKTLRVLSTLDGSPLSVIPTYLGGSPGPSGNEGPSHAYADWVISEILPTITRRRLARFADVDCGRHGFRVDDARRYLEAARRAGLGLKVHAEHLSPSVGVRLAVEFNATSADHLDAVGRDDIPVLAQSSAVATLLPGAAFHLGLDHYPPARAFIDQGVAVALATDYNPASSPTCNMQMVLSLASTHMAMSPAEAIAAATINGAHALGMANRIGSLETGKWADFTMFEASDYREIPYHFGVNLAMLTVKSGAVLYRQGETACRAD